MCAKIDPDTRRELRRSYRCPCGEWANRPGREALPLADDPGERMLAAMEKVTRLRQDTCPWQAMRDPYVIRVLQAYKWWKAGQLEANFGGDVPEAIRQGIDVYDSALNATISHDLEAERKRREAEAVSRASPGRPEAPRMARRGRF